MLVKQIELARIEPSGNNVRRHSLKSLKSLADNILEIGLINPITVIHRGGAKYEIIAGHRRYEACKLLSINRMSCSIIEGSEQVVQAMRITENLVRENLHPLDEAEAIAKLRRLDMTYEQIGTQLGLSPKLVARRESLNHLSPLWYDAIRPEDGVKAHKLSVWPVSHLELIAKFPEDVQDEWLKTFTKGWRSEELSLKDLTNRLSQSEPRLSTAPFDTHDPDLIPNAGSCNLCQTRSSCQSLLFDEVSAKAIAKNDRCLNLTCWKAKHAQAIEQKRKQAIELHGKKLVYVSTQYHPDNYKHGKPLMCHKWDKCSKTNKRARPGFVVDGYTVGEIIWITVDSPVKTAASSSANFDPGTPKTMKEKQQDLKGLRLKIVAEMMSRKLRSGKCIINHNGPKVGVCQLATVVSFFLSFGLHESNSLSGWNDFKKLKAMPQGGDETARMVNLAWPKIRDRIVEQLGYIRRGQDGLKNEKHLQAIALMISLDWTDLWEAAVKAKPEPKSWAKSEKKA